MTPKEKSDRLTWFKFTPQDWIMGKIQRCDEITQARFMKLCCLYWNKGCEFLYNDACDHLDQEVIDQLIKRRIIVKDDDQITISFLDAQFDEVMILIGKRKKAGSRGGSKSKANAKQLLSKPEGDKIREEKIRKEKEDIDPLQEAFDQTLTDFKAMRRAIKKPMTEKAINLLLLRLERLFPENKVDQIESMNQSILNSWQGVFEIKDHYRTNFMNKPKKKDDALSKLRDEHQKREGSRK